MSQSQKKGGRGKTAKAPAKPKAQQKETSNKSAPKIKKAPAKKDSGEKKGQDPPNLTKAPQDLSLRERLAQNSGLIVPKMPVKMGTQANTGQADLDFSKIGTKRVYAEKNETQDEDMFDDDEPLPQQSRARKAASKKVQIIDDSESEF